MKDSAIMAFVLWKLVPMPGIIPKQHCHLTRCPNSAAIWFGQQFFIQFFAQILARWYRQGHPWPKFWLVCWRFELCMASLRGQHKVYKLWYNFSYFVSFFSPKSPSLKKPWSLFTSQTFLLHSTKSTTEVQMLFNPEHPFLWSNGRFRP